MITSANLKHTWNSGRQLAFKDLQIAKGEQWLLLGESGSGKTTLLHLVGGLLGIREGKIRINNVDLGSLSASDLDRFRGEHIGFIFQKNHLISSLTVVENLLMAPFMAGVAQHRDKAMNLLAELDLASRANARIKELSHGQAQRVAIARSLMNDPALLLADEPTSALDNRNCDVVIKLLMKLATDHQATLVIATHDQRLVSSIPNTIHL